MANVSRISGFKPVKSLVGGSWTSLMRKYQADAAKTNPIYIGDVVTLAADGNVEVAVTNDTVLGVVVALGEDTTTFGETGYFNANDLGKRFLAAGEAGAVAVVPAELSLFEAYTAAATNLNLSVGDSADIDGENAGSTVTGNSGMHLVASVNADVKVVEQVTAPDNDPTAADARYIVKFNKTENALN